MSVERPLFLYNNTFVVYAYCSDGGIHYIIVKLNFFLNKIKSTVIYDGVVSYRVARPRDYRGVARGL